jgi:hypothetical protein
MNRVRLGAVVLADLGALVTLRPHGSLIARLRHPASWIAQVGADRVVATLCATGIWLAAAWLALGIAGATVAALPGSIGRVGHRVARAVLPRTLYRIVAGAAGLGVLLSPVLASGAPAPRPGSAVAAMPTPTPQWPSDAPVPVPLWPTNPAARPTRTPEHRRAQPSRSAPHRSQPQPVVVRRGDTLWRIAADHLPGHPSAQRIAASWPRWYAANRAVIGADPDLIVPGQHLYPPAKGSAP